MKKILLILSFAALCLTASAQAQITTKKMKIADFPDRTMRVVLTGNVMFDSAVQDEMRRHWQLSPFEFCTNDEFNRSKTNPEYYFMMFVKGQFKKESEPGLQMLTILKGGVGAQESLDAMYEVALVPICPVEDPDGREFVFLPAILDILQDYIKVSMETDLEGYAGLANYTINLSKTKDMDIVFADSDLASDVTKEVRDLYIRDGVRIAGVDEIDELMLAGTPNTVVAYTVMPANPRNGSYCYKMLIGCEDHTLYYYRRHKIGRYSAPGILAEDVKRIAGKR